MQRKRFLVELARILIILTLLVAAESVAQTRVSASALHAASLTIRTTPARKGLKAAVQRKGTITPHVEQLLGQQGIQQRHRELSAQVLGLLSPECQQRLEVFSVLYDNPKHRGLAGRGVVIVSGKVPDREFVGLLLHEALGHFRDITCVTGTEASGASTFKDGSEPVFRDDPSAAFYGISWTNEKQRRRSARPQDFVTGYAFKADSFEDLAESVTYYIAQEEAFRERARRNPVLARKLRWLETHMPKTVEVTGIPWDGKIAWDATKLAFEWKN